MAWIGAHISVAGGLCRAFERADAIGCESMQIFTRNQRQWQNSSLSFKEIDDFYRASRSSSVKAVVSHASYLINLAGAPDVRTRSVTALIEEIKRCHQLGIDDTVLHPGFAGGESPEIAIKKISESLMRVLDATSDSRVRILLETMAGQGSAIGGDIAQFSRLLDLVGDHPRISFCVDLCHVFAAGYEIRTEESYSRFISMLSKYVGLENVHCWHLSDSRMNKGSRKDRHAHLGQGEIGLGPFSMLLGDEHFSEIPAILETPKDGWGDEGNLSILRKLRGS
ncbi:MAG: deoxyribonuclease IV [Synergistaceae bacterium]|nr:deoxyribonuclease IV [Synergistaceae bacterium]